MHAHTRVCSAEKLLSSSRSFVSWLDHHGIASYDPYDLWGTRYGLWSRKKYYARRLVGTPLVAPFVAVDLLYPAARKLFVNKQRFATADAQLLLAFLNLHRATGEQQYLDRAITLGDEILDYAIPGYHGPCWGYPFDWQNGPGDPWTRNTPYITCTPYCYEAYNALFAATGQERYRKLAAGIAEFVCRDLRETPTSPRAAAGSYSPKDNSQVVNASAYRAFVLIDAGARFGRADYTAAGERNLAFVIESQRADGAWLYAVDGTSSFIDNFHTCFNLKNLVKLNRLVRRGEVSQCINRGFDYYHDHLFHADGDPRSFAIEPRLQLAHLEMYNFAEGITLGSLLANENGRAKALAHHLAGRVADDFQLPDGHFVTRVFRGGVRHTFPFVRWPQAQLFLAITNLLCFVKGTEAPAREVEARSN